MRERKRSTTGARHDDRRTFAVTAGPAVILAAAIVLGWVATLPVAAEDAATPSPPPTPRKELFWHETKTLVPVGLVFPPGFEPERAHTLVVALHGYGSSIEQFRRVAENLASAGFLVALPEATYAFDIGGKIGYDWTLTHREDEPLEVKAATILVKEYLPALVREIERIHEVDRVHVLGFSQGAVVALLAGIHEPSIFDGVISFGLPAFNPSWFDGDVLAAGRGVRVLLVHGDEDDRASIEVSEQTREYLAAAGYDATFLPFAGGHTVPSEQLARAAEWIRPRPPSSTAEGD